jgi:phospholipase/carboxylesterase
LIQITDFALGTHQLMPWFKRLEEFGVTFETVKVVGTTAPERATDLYNGWICNSWYDYLTDRVYEEEEINTKEVAQSRRVLTEIVEDEVRVLGNAQQVLLVGFSQGTTMALDVALAYPEMLAGVVARRGHLLSCTALADAKKLMPICAYHGENDDGIGFEVAKAGYKKMEHFGFKALEFHAEEGLNHTAFSEREMTVFAAFLIRLFPHLKKGE